MERGGLDERATQRLSCSEREEKDIKNSNGEKKRRNYMIGVVEINGISKMERGKILIFCGETFTLQ